MNMIQGEKLHSIPLCNINIEDAFWSKYTQLVGDVIIPYQLDILNDNVEGAEPSHCLNNFRIAAKRAEGEFGGAVFQDTDVAKWLEAVAFSLSSSFIAFPSFAFGWCSILVPTFSTHGVHLLFNLLC